MTDTGLEGKDPIRVVLFGGGPVLERGVRQFIYRLEAHPEIGADALTPAPGLTHALAHAAPLLGGTRPGASRLRGPR